MDALKWTDPQKPNSEIGYDHVIAQTPFGRILITWKSWKEYDYPTVDEHPVIDGAYKDFGTLEEVKAGAEQRYFDAIAAPTQTNRPALLAPQAGNPDGPARYVCREHGAQPLDYCNICARENFEDNQV